MNIPNLPISLNMRDHRLLVLYNNYTAYRDELEHVKKFLDAVKKSEKDPTAYIKQVAEENYANAKRLYQEAEKELVDFYKMDDKIGK